MLLETERLTIRSFTPSDVDSYHRIVGDPDVMAHLGGVLNRDAAQRYIERAIETERSHGFARYAVLSSDDGALIGMCGYAPVRNYIDLGYRFAKRVWGEGLATEAASAVVTVGFEKFGFDEIVGLSHPDNTASINVLLKLGFSYQRDEVTPTGMPAKRFVATRSSEST